MCKCFVLCKDIIFLEANAKSSFIFQLTIARCAGNDCKQVLTTWQASVDHAKVIDWYINEHAIHFPKTYYLCNITLQTNISTHIIKMYYILLAQSK